MSFAEITLLHRMFEWTRANGGVPLGGTECRWFFLTIAGLAQCTVSFNARIERHRSGQFDTIV